jgi:hypothetical protein
VTTRGKPAWNKGLTKTTDLRVAAYTTKSGASRKGKLYEHMVHTGPNPKISEALQEYFADPENRAKSQGDRGSNWKGDAVSYGAMHTRLKKLKTGLCLMCGPVTRTTMALIHGRATRFARTDGRGYSIDPNDYVELCYKCHNEYDRGSK